MTREQKRRKTLPVLHAPDGTEIRKRFKNEYWFDRRRTAPSPYTRGFPETVHGSIQAAGRLIMTGQVSKIRCTDRVQGRVQWTLVRGERVPGTQLYAVLPHRGDYED